MKIKLPEKRYFSVDELAERWECKASDIEHLFETRQLRKSDRFAVKFGAGARNTNVKFVDASEIKPGSTQMTIKDGYLTFLIPVPTGTLDTITPDARNLLCENYFKEFSPHDKSYNEVAILLNDVIDFERACSDDGEVQEAVTATPPAHVSISGTTFAKLIAAIEAFDPTRPPRTKKELMLTLADMGCKTRDQQVFAQIIAEHFGIEF